MEDKTEKLYSGGSKVVWDERCLELVVFTVHTLNTRKKKRRSEGNVVEPQASFHHKSQGVKAA